MPAEVGAPKTARPPVHLFAQQLGELSKNLGRLLLGEGVLAVAELAAALPPSCRCWCWWEMIPEVRHNGTRAACVVCTTWECLVCASGSLGRAASTCNDGDGAPLCVPCASGSLRRAASTCNAMALCAALCLESLPWGSKLSEACLLHASSQTCGGWDECCVRGHAAGLRASLCEPAAKSGWISRPETTAQAIRDSGTPQKRLAHG